MVGGFIKNDVRRLLDERVNLTRSLLNKFTKQFKSAASDFEYLQLSEIEQADKNMKQLANLISERKKITILFYSKKSLHVYEGKAAKKLLKDGAWHELKVKQNSAIYHGQIGSLGKASGRVVVVKNSQEAIQKMRSGDILVATYTAAEYLPAMRRASAIITETGGITSHAAIVARELNIPCVIGIKNITTLLSNGQIIEVNADRGLVKII